jgi:hypothetical protein
MAAVYFVHLRNATPELHKTRRLIVHRHHLQRAVIQGAACHVGTTCEHAEKIGAAETMFPLYRRPRFIKCLVAVDQR